MKEELFEVGDTVTVVFPDSHHMNSITGQIIYTPGQLGDCWKILVTFTGGVLQKEYKKIYLINHFLYMFKEVE